MYVLEVTDNSFLKHAQYAHPKKRLDPGNISAISSIALQGFFQAVCFTTVYQMKIEFSINLAQSHPRSTRLRRC